MGAADVGAISYPARAREGYADDLLANLDKDAIRRRAFRIVVDYGYSAASFVLPLVLGPLGVEAVAATRSRTSRRGDGDAPGARRPDERLVGAVGADLGVVFDRAAERLYLIDDQAREIPVEQALLLYLRLIGSDGRVGKLAFPVTVTSQVDRLVEGSSLEVVRTASLAELTKAAQDGVIFAGAVGGGYVFPEFLPAYDAIASLCKLLELLAPVDRKLSELVAELPVSHVVHRQVPCPWAQKGSSCAFSPSGSRIVTSTCRTGSRSSTSAAGRRCFRTPTSRSSTCTPRARARMCRRSWSRSCAAS